MDLIHTNSIFVLISDILFNIIWQQVITKVHAINACSLIEAQQC